MKELKQLLPIKRYDKEFREVTTTTSKCCEAVMVNEGWCVCCDTSTEARESNYRHLVRLSEFVGNLINTRSLFTGDNYSSIVYEQSTFHEWTKAYTDYITQPITEESLKHFVGAILDGKFFSSKMVILGFCYRYETFEDAISAKDKDGYNRVVFLIAD